MSDAHLITFNLCSNSYSTVLKVLTYVAPGSPYNTLKFEIDSLSSVGGTEV